MIQFELAFATTSILTIAIDSVVALIAGLGPAICLQRINVDGIGLGLGTIFHLAVVVGVVFVVPIGAVIYGLMCRYVRVELVI